MLIGGAGLTLIGSCILVVEGRVPTAGEHTWRTRLAHGRRIFAFGGLLIGLSTFQAEFDFGVPQFSLALEPVMLAFAAGVALVGARIWIGPGAALGAALFFIAIRGALALLVGPGLGETTPHFPLYLAEALSIELLALVVATRRPYVFGAIGGLSIGTVGFAAEYGWSHLWMPVPWPEGLVADVLPAVLVTAVGAGLIGAFMASALLAAEGGSRAAPASAPPMPSIAPAAAGLVAIALVVGLNVGASAPEGLRGEVTLSEVGAPPKRTVDAEVRIVPAAAADDARWLTATAWQGGEKLVVDHLEEVGPGLYRTTEPLPVHGTWKTLIRLHKDDALLGLPIFMPEDEAIPAEAVPAPQGTFVRPLVDETEILQRELKADVPTSLALLGYSIVGSIVLALIVLLGWVLVRLGRGGDSHGPTVPTATAETGSAGGRRVGSREATA